MPGEFPGNSLAEASKLLHAFACGEPLPAGGMHVLITCLPKTGSTWLTNLFSSLPGFHFAELVPGHGRREQELSEWELAKWHNCNTVSARHVCHSAFTESLVRAFGIRVIFLVRDLRDVLASLDDHLFRESIEMPMGYMDEDYKGWDQPKRLDMMVDLVAPWAIRHYISWIKAGYTPVAYERLQADPNAVFRMLVNKLGLRFSDNDCLQAIERAHLLPSRFNKGKVGRGAELFSQDHTERLRHFTVYYPDVDFSPLGL